MMSSTSVLLLSVTILQLCDASGGGLRGELPQTPIDGGLRGELNRRLAGQTITDKLAQQALKAQAKAQAQAQVLEQVQAQAKAQVEQAQAQAQQAQAQLVQVEMEHLFNNLNLVEKQIQASPPTVQKAVNDALDGALKFYIQPNTISFNANPIEGQNRLVPPKQHDYFKQAQKAAQGLDDLRTKLKEALKVMRNYGNTDLRETVKQAEQAAQSAINEVEQLVDSETPLECCACS